MFWWQGRGIWVLGIGAFFVLPLQKVAGDAAVAIGLTAAAAAIFLLRDWFGEASMFSISVKYWPALFLGFALISALGR